MWLSFQAALFGIATPFFVKSEDWPAAVGCGLAFLASIILAAAFNIVEALDKNQRDTTQALSRLGRDVANMSDDIRNEIRRSLR